MHLGETLLGHIKNCNKCQYRYYTVMHNRNSSVSSMIRHADKVMKLKESETKCLKHSI